MEFVLVGFIQSGSMRKFTFESIGADHRRTPVVVLADLSLARAYAIQLQDLPLVCREFLEGSEPGVLAAGPLTLNEAHMAALKKARNLIIEEKKPRRSRPPVSANLGNAWRGTTSFTTAIKTH